MMNGLDTNGVNQQRHGVNEFNDGQPFAPIPQIDWSSGHATAHIPDDHTEAENAGHTFNFITEKRAKLDGESGTSSASIGAGESGTSSASIGAGESGTSRASIGAGESPSANSDNEDKQLGKNNSNNSNDQNLVMSDSVKLPPSSSLFSHLKKSLDSSECKKTSEQVSQDSDSADKSNETNDVAKSSDNVKVDGGKDLTTSSDKMQDNASGSELDMDKEDDESSSEELPEVFEDSKEETVQQSSTEEPEESDEPPEKKVEFINQNK